MGTNEREPQGNPMAITANELKHRLDGGGPIIVLDMGKKNDMKGRTFQVPQIL